MKRKKKKINYSLIMAIFIAVVMMTSIMGYMWQGGDGGETVKMGDYTFSRVSSYWQVKYEGQFLKFSYLPDTLLDINVTDVAIEKMLATKMVYTTSDVNDVYAESIAQTIFELRKELGENLMVFLVNGFTENTTYNLPIITCDNATQFVPVMLLKEGDSSRIYLDGECIVFEAKETYQFIRLKDKLLYKMYGIL